MKPRLPNLPEFKSEAVLIPSSHFNRVRLALARLGRPLFELLGQKGLEFRIEQHAWLCSDIYRNRAPLIAWTDFGVGRDSLHRPIPARLILYSAYAGAIAYTALDLLAERLERRLQEEGPPRGARIVAHPGRRRAG